MKTLSALLFLIALASGGAFHGWEVQTQTGITSNGQVERGTFLFHACQASTRVMDSPTVSGSNISDGAFCNGYFHGFGDYNDMNSGSSICLGGASVGTSIRVYVAYMEKNPKLLDDAMVIGVIYPLKDAYPCPAPKS